MSALLARFVVLIAAAWVLPALAVRPTIALARRMRRTVTNYRGATVPIGLGLVWVVWALLMGALVPTTTRLGSTSVILLTATIGVCLLGLFDDLIGSGEHRGLRGHLGALARGRITTGLVKLVGIVGLAAWVAWAVGGTAAQAGAGWAAPPAGLNGGDVGAPTTTARWVVAIVVWVLIAASANLGNLLDTGPGRSLKGYLVTVAMAGALAPLAGSVMFAGAQWPGVVGAAGVGPLSGGTAALATWIVLAGPALAAWPADLRERAVLGDAGANASGFLAGAALAFPLAAGSLGAAPGPALAWQAALGFAAAVAVALNLLAERVSFSAVIARTPWLRALDALGRPHDADG